MLEHELGHVIGLSDNTEAGDLMDITLGLGVRRAPTSADLAAIVPASSTVVPAVATNVGSYACRLLAWCFGGTYGRSACGPEWHQFSDGHRDRAPSGP